MIFRSKSLRNLNLSSCHITDKMIDLFLKYDMKYIHINHLNLENNSIQEKGAEVLLGFSQIASSIISMNLKNNCINEKLLKDINKVLRGNEIIHNKKKPKV